MCAYGLFSGSSVCTLIVEPEKFHTLMNLFLRDIMSSLSFTLPYTKTGALNIKAITESQFNEILQKTKFIHDVSKKSIRERIYVIKNCITECPKCAHCSQPVKFLRGCYNTYCSIKCSRNDPSQITKMKQTCIEKYGVEYSFQSFDVKEKAKQTCIEKYGVEYAAQSTKIKMKMKQSMMERYGVENAAQSSKIKEKMAIGIVKYFQERRNYENTDYSGTVYILYFKELDLVKIGLTGDFNKRSKGLVKDFGEFEILELIETNTCFAIEKDLHDKFNDYRICLDEGSGRTEFFTCDVRYLWGENKP